MQNGQVQSWLKQEEGVYDPLHDSQPLILPPLQARGETRLSGRDEGNYT